MTDSTKAPTGRLQVQFALAAALALTAASAATNLTSAVKRFADLPSTIIAGTTAAAVAVLVTISLAAALSAFRRKAYGSGIACMTAFALAAAFSTSAALGTLGKPRLEASAHVAHDASERSRLVAERARALTELGTLSPTTRTPAELAPQIAALLAMPGLGSPPCAAVDGPVTRKACPALAALQTESAQSSRRAALEGTVARIDRDLAALTKPGSIATATADAAAIAHVANALGLSISAETVNTALMVLAVLILEVGGGLSLAVAAALKGDEQLILPASAPADHVALAKTSAVHPAAVSPSAPEQPAISIPAPTPAATGAAQPATGGNTTTRQKVLALIEASGGTVRMEQRGLARQLGVAPSTINRLVADLEAKRILTKRVSATGTVLALA